MKSKIGSSNCLKYNRGSFYLEFKTTPLGHELYQTVHSLLSKICGTHMALWKSPNDLTCEIAHQKVTFIAL